jgi:Flp pilus assembly protein TadB
MADPEQENRGTDVPAAFYQMIRRQTEAQGRSGLATVLACVLFVLIGAFLVIALEFGADIEQILTTVFAVAAVNLVIALVWLSTARSTH